MKLLDRRFSSELSAIREELHDAALSVLDSQPAFLETPDSTAKADADADADPAEQQGGSATKDMPALLL